MTIDVQAQLAQRQKERDEVPGWMRLLRWTILAGCLVSALVAGVCVIAMICSGLQ